MKFIININSDYKCKKQTSTTGSALLPKVRCEQNKKAQGIDNISVFPRFSTNRVSVPEQCFSKLTIKGKSNSYSQKKGPYLATIVPTPSL